MFETTDLMKVNSILKADETIVDMDKRMHWDDQFRYIDVMINYTLDH